MEHKLTEPESFGQDITLIDCKLTGLKFYGVNSVEIIISPVHERWYRRLKTWVVGKSEIFRGHDGHNE